jgi:pimeloyl-ACP methyl ester carboxylesterase
MTWVRDEIRALVDYAQAPRKPDVKRLAIIFIHGIYSSVDTFEPMYSSLCDSEEIKKRSIEFWYYDYNFHNSLENNGRAFAQLLLRHFTEGDKVVIVAHSMGGLVSRLALIGTRLSFVKLLFLLGTPNCGAVRLAQLGLLSGLIQEEAGGLFALFPRKAGIADLTRASKLLKSSLQTHGVANVGDVCYVSIPGLVFHQGQGTVEYFRAGRSKLFGAIAVTSEVVSQLLPFFSIKFERPHDGIVEEVSNNLITCPTWHEKNSSIGPQRGNQAYTYLHVRILPNCENLDHIQVHKDPRIISTVERLSIVAFDHTELDNRASCLKTWVKSFTSADRSSYNIKFEA